MKEQWERVENTHHFVSNIGNVRIEQWVDCMGHTHKPKTCKLKTGTHGYYVVNIGKQPRLVHRLVCEAFIDNSLNKYTVNHKDGDKLNNSHTNLEWASYSENNAHAYKVLNKRNGHEGKRGKLHHRSKPVRSISHDGSTAEYESQHLAAESIECKQHGISQAIRLGIRCKGMYWEFV